MNIVEIVLLFVFVVIMAIMIYAFMDSYNCDWCGRQKKFYKFEFHKDDKHVCKKCVKKLNVYTFREYEKYKMLRERAENSLRE